MFIKMSEDIDLAEKHSSIAALLKSINTHTHTHTLLLPISGEGAKKDQKRCTLFEIAIPY